jgi:hypothetical protein
MKQIHRLLVIIGLLLTHYQFVNAAVITRFIPRSQVRDKSVTIAGMTNYTHIYTPDTKIGGELSLTPEYTTSFRPKEIAVALFGPVIVPNTNNDAQTALILVQGSSVKASSSGNPLALVAENFYLPPNFFSQITIAPHISNFLLNYDVYSNLDCLCDGIYVRFYGALVNTRWNLHFNETLITTGSTAITAGFLAVTDVPATDLLMNASQYFIGLAPAPTAGNGNIDGAPVPLSSNTPTTMNNLAYDRLSNEPLHATRLADIYAEIGWDFCVNPDYHVGIDFIVAFPLGLTPSSQLLFAPCIGDNAWQCGGGLTAHYIWWRSDCDDLTMGIYLDANITHLFKRKQHRVFDIKNAPLSRYLLAERFGPNTENLGGSPTTLPFVFTPADVQFAYQVSPVANIAQRTVKVHYDVQADIVAWFTIQYCCMTWDVGYNFWARSHEKITPTNTNSFVFDSTNQWGLKGNVQLFGYDDTVVPVNVFPLSATQSTAQINTSIPNPSIIGDPANDLADAAQLAFIGATPLVANPDTGVPDINTSIQPILLTENSLDYASSLYSSSNKLFTHFNVVCTYKEWCPFIGIGGYVECGIHPSHHTKQASNTVHSAVSSWGIWVKGGTTF